MLFSGSLLCRRTEERFWSKPLPERSGNGKEDSEEYAQAVVDWQGRIEDRRREILARSAATHRYEPSALESWDVCINSSFKMLSSGSFNMRSWV